MAITIPDRTQIRLVTDFDEPQNGHSLPAVLASVAMTNPGPVVIDPAGVAANGQAQVKPAGGGNGANGYIGFNPDPNIALGAPLSPCKSILIDGFAGVVPGSDVYIDLANTADSSGTASGLTQTQPTGGQVVTDAQIRPGDVAATASFDIEVPDGVTSLAEIDLTVTGAVAANDTNFWTFALTNLGVNGAGSTAMLAATAANTTQLTGGSGLAADVPRPLTLAVVGNLAVTPGQVLRLTATKTSAATTLSGLVARASFNGSGGGTRVGTGWSTTKIFFF